MSATHLVDCLIIGAGPAGLTAATYLRRFRRTIAVIDANESRARWIPTSHNCPGFPLGVSGESLLSRMRAQAADFGAEPVHARIVRLRCSDAVFTAESENGDTWQAAMVILATGVVDVLPVMDDAIGAVTRGVLRICAICDALEASDSAIAVFGPAATALSHAKFLRTFSQRVSVVPDDAGGLDEALIDDAAVAGVALLPPARTLHADATHVSVQHADGSTRRFDVMYPALGAVSQSDLALQVGARVADDGALLCDAHQRTSVPGLYAIGDVVSALNQIAVAVGHAAIAATSVHNALPRNVR